MMRHCSVTVAIQWMVAAAHAGRIPHLHLTSIERGRTTDGNPHLVAIKTGPDE